MSPHIATLAFTLLGTSTLSASPSERDGFYRVTPALKEALANGKPADELPLGEELALAPKKTEIVQRDNKGERFGLSLAFDRDDKLDGPTSYLVIVGDHILRQNASGTEGDHTSYLHFEIRGKRAAEETAHFFEADLQYRRHPGHRLAVEFVPTKNPFAAGEKITATLKIRNAGKEPFAFMKGGRNRAARDNQFRFTAEHNGKPVIDIGSTNNFGGLAGKQVIQPGETFEDTVELAKWFAFDKPGFYDILGSYYLDIQQPGGDFDTIWEEWVSAQFMVIVEAPKPGW